LLTYYGVILYVYLKSGFSEYSCHLKILTTPHTTRCGYLFSQFIFDILKSEINIVFLLTIGNGLSKLPNLTPLYKLVPFPLRTNMSDCNYPRQQHCHGSPQVQWCRLCALRIAYLHVTVWPFPLENIELAFLCCLPALMSCLALFRI